MAQQSPLTIVKSEPLEIVKSEPLDQPPKKTSFATLADVFKAQFPHLAIGTDLLIGAGKGVVNTALGASELINKTLRTNPNTDWDAARQDLTTPTNTAQSIGKGAEQVAEFLVPGGQVARGAKALQGMTSAVRGGKALATAGRAALEGASGAAVHSAQTGSTEGAATVGAMGAAGSVIGSAMSKAGPALRESAEKKVAQALGATKEKYKALSAKRAPEILRRGLTGSRQGLLDDATANAKEVGQAIDGILLEHGQMPLSTRSVSDALEQAKSGFVIMREMSPLEAFNTGALKQPGAKLTGKGVQVPVVIDERAVTQLTKLQETIAQLGDEVPLEKLIAVRRIWDDIVDRAGGFAHKSEGSRFGVPLAESTEAWAKKQGANALRKLFAEQVPDIKAVNAEYAFWADLKKILQATEARTQAQGPGLNRMVSATVGASVGASSGGIANAVAGGVLAPKIYQALTSPRFRLMDAHARNKLADVLMSGDTKAISAALAALTSGATR